MPAAFAQRLHHRDRISRHAGAFPLVRQTNRNFGHFGQHGLGFLKPVAPNRNPRRAPAGSHPRVAARWWRTARDRTRWSSSSLTGLRLRTVAATEYLSEVMRT